MMGSVSATSDDGMLEIGGEDGKLGQGRGEYLYPKYMSMIRHFPWIFSEEVLAICRTKD